MKKYKLLTVILSVFLITNSLIVSVSADSGVIDEKWGNPTFVYGGSLTDEQIKETKDLLEITGDSVDLKIGGKDMVRLLGSGNPNANMYSSALISGNDTEGIVVQIVTPENITKVTINQFANALITAGVTNVSVKVGSPVKVTGESALTGVYLAYEDKGYELNKENMVVAQDELSTVVDIVEANSDVEGFNEESLNLALIEIKQGLAEIKEDNPEGNITDKEIEKVVLDSLKNNNLKELITEEQVQSLVGLAKKYSNLDNLMSEEMQEQLTTLAKDVGSKAAEIAKDLGGKVSETLKDEGFWEGIKNFFSKIIDAISGLFTKDKPETE